MEWKHIGAEFELRCWAVFYPLPDFPVCFKAKFLSERTRNDGNDRAHKRLERKTKSVLLSMSVPKAKRTFFLRGAMLALYPYAPDWKKATRNADLVMCRSRREWNRRNLLKWRRPTESALVFFYNSNPYSHSYDFNFHFELRTGAWSFPLPISPFSIFLMGALQNDPRCLKHPFYILFMINAFGIFDRGFENI